ncbi:TRAP transporter small permease [Salinarimonas rosea]|uniref:TRAP transporter small permease n=1 Tax=Salinarimonas rosea TaxID=552063 RepID=UPI00041E63B1|nr:TRAP transporter small permease [Salinarimonas rosea]
MLAALKLVDRTVFHVALTLAMVLLVAMAGVSFYQVITRFVFEQPSTWSEVTSRSLQIWMVYLGLVAAFRTGSLMAVDMLQRLAPKRLELVVICAVAGLNLGVLAVMFWHGWSMAERVRFQTLAGVDNPFTGGGISIALVYTAIPVGAALSIVAVVARLAEEVDRVRKGAAVPVPEARARLESEGA